MCNMSHKANECHARHQQPYHQEPAHCQESCIYLKVHLTHKQSKTRTFTNQWDKDPTQCVRTDVDWVSCSIPSLHIFHLKIHLPGQTDMPQYIAYCPRRLILLFQWKWPADYCYSVQSLGESWHQTLALPTSTRPAYDHLLNRQSKMCIEASFFPLILEFGPKRYQDAGSNTTYRYLRHQLVCSRHYFEQFILPQ